MSLLWQPSQPHQADVFLVVKLAAGKVNLCSPDHVSLLVHNVFNASIPRHHIPSESWEFEYGPADNDPEVAVEAAATKEGSKDGDVEMAEGTAQTQHEPEHPESSTSSGGRWVHSLTGDMIGGKSGYVEFTVIGYVPPRPREPRAPLTEGVKTYNCEPDAVCHRFDSTGPFLTRTRPKENRTSLARI